MTQTVHNNLILSNTQAYKAHTPSASRIVEADKETRIDLPFYLIFESITYIGVVLREMWHVPPHYHDHFELCYVDEGQGWFAIDEFSYKVKQGDLFLTKPGEIHQGAAAGNSPFRLYYLGFRLENMNSLEMDYYRLGINRVVCDAENTMCSLFDAIFAELRDRQTHALEMVQSHFLRLLVHVLRTYEHTIYVQEQDGAPLTLSPLLRQILYHLHADAGNFRTIEDLALQVNMSRSHLTREFKRYMGVAPGQYMRVLCLNRARHYLRATPDSISSIAARLHFSSIHTFSIFFKRHTGMSPQEYRRQVATLHIA